MVRILAPVEHLSPQSWIELKREVRRGDPEIQDEHKEIILEVIRVHDAIVAGGNPVPRGDLRAYVKYNDLQVIKFVLPEPYTERGGTLLRTFYLPERRVNAGQRAGGAAARAEQNPGEETTQQERGVRRSIRQGARLAVQPLTAEAAQAQPGESGGANGANAVENGVEEEDGDTIVVENGIGEEDRDTIVVDSSQG